MGYRKPERTIVLEFEGDEYDGLYIEVRSLPIKQYLTVAKAFDEIEEDMSKMEVVFRIFSERIKRWNMEDEDGCPLPANYDTVSELDTDFVMMAVASWMEGIAGVKKDLGKGSNSGETSPGPLPPMETL